MLTAWFNNAGVGDDGTLAELSEEAVRRLVEVNLLGTLWGMRAAIAAFEESGRGGDIVNTASLAGPRAGAGLQRVRRHQGRDRVGLDVRRRRDRRAGSGCTRCARTA